MRCSASVAFLHPALERENLTVITGTVGAESAAVGA